MLAFTWLVGTASAFNLTWLDWDPFGQDSAIAPRAVATPLVPQGVEAQLRGGETHIYEIPQDSRSEGISLSVCNYEGAGGNLQIIVNQTAFETTDGLGTLSNFNFYSSNGTLTIKTPSSNSSDTWDYQLGIGGSASDTLVGTTLYLVDTDFSNALLVTSPLEQISALLLTEYGSIGASDTVTFLNNQTLGTSNFTVNVFAANNTKMQALSSSYCAAQRNSLVNQNNADLSTTKRGRTADLRSQFLMTGLNISETYTAFLGLPAPQRGYLGGMLFPSLEFSTKSSTSCQVIYNMSFCTEMAFAVPGNASAYTAAELTHFYDQMAQERYQNFSYSLEQINCNTDPVNMFSPLKQCSDCSAAYKNWLCTTTIPRCADMTNNASYLVTRNPGQSRNPEIDEVIQPGPYKEILPCAELCYSLVRDCPVALGFGCPSGDLLNMCYGQYSDGGDVTCSYPGAVYDESRGVLIGPALGLLFASLILFIDCM